MQAVVGFALVVPLSRVEPHVLHLPFQSPLAGCPTTRPGGIVSGFPRLMVLLYHLEYILSIGRMY